MGKTWVTRMIDTNQYSKVICDGWVIEIIPDISNREYSNVLIHVTSIHRVVSQKHSGFGDYISSDYMKIDLKSVDVNTFKETPTIKYEDMIFGWVFEVSFQPTDWRNGKLVTGIVRLAIHPLE